MSKTILTEGEEEVRSIVNDDRAAPSSARSPVHVVYGGADRFTADTPAKLGRIALNTLKEYASNFVRFASVFDLVGEGRLPSSPHEIAELGSRFGESPGTIKNENRAAWFALSVYDKTVRKLETEPVEDFRIDFEDGYGFRSNEEEDADAVKASSELAAAADRGTLTSFCGFRIKSFGRETHGRALRTLKLFVNSLLDKTGGRLPENFVVTLPKVTDKYQVKELRNVLGSIEEERGLNDGSIGIELMVETPEAIYDRKGRVALKGMVDAAEGRCTSVHFGAYDYTAALGISASYQDIRHSACVFARNAMQAALAGTGVRLVDSVTTLMPVPVHKKDRLSDEERGENERSVHAGWLKHFSNVTASMADGFYQSWDLHPNQMVARYAAVYAFFLNEFDSQAARLRGYINKATQATLTGNTFDDAASVAGLVNFFERGIACGAFSEEEVTSSIGITLDDLSERFNRK